MYKLFYELEYILFLFGTLSYYWFEHVMLPKVKQKAFNYNTDGMHWEFCVSTLLDV